MFDRTGPEQIELESTRVIDAAGATHLTIQTGAYFRERVAIGLSNIENRNWTEICHDPDALVGLAVGVIRGDSSNNWGQDPDGLLAAADAPPQLSPRVEACHASRRWLLDEDQNGVAE